MKKMIVVLSFVFTGSLGGLPTAWAKCETLYTHVQDSIRQAETQRQNDAQTLAEAKRCAEAGLQRHRENRHPEARQILQACLELLEH